MRGIASRAIGEAVKSRGHGPARSLTIAALLAVVAFAPSAGAQPAPPAPPAPPGAPSPRAIDPRPISSQDVDYPAGGQGDATVLLWITVGKDGSVRSVDVKEGDEPFASAAKKAAQGWLYVPATRDGAPFAAKIGVAVLFAAPAPPPPEPLPAEAHAENAAPAPKPKARAPIEVVIRAEKPPPSVSTLTRAEVRQIPGTFGDPFRAIEILPGVTPIVSGLPYFYVRGAPPGNVGYFLDGVRVPYLFHVAVGPSIVNPAMVEKVDLYSGGYPAQFGRYSGAIVTAETTAPRDDFHGEGNLRVFDAGAMVEGGFADGRGTVMLGGRYSYTGAIFSLISPTVKLDYRDYQARITYDLTPRDRIGLFAFGAYDLLQDVQNNITTTLFGAEFYRFDARYEHRTSNSGMLRWNTTVGFDQSKLGETRNMRDTLFDTRLSLTQPLGKGVIVRAGADAQFDNYRADPRKWSDPADPSTIAFDAAFPQRYDTALGGWADVIWRLNRRLEVTPGVRFDLYRSSAVSALGADPRLSVRVDVTDHIRLLHALGVAHQPPSFFVPTPGVQLGDLKGGLQTSLQASSGIEVELPEQTTATVTAFDNVFLNMTDTLSVQAPRDVTTSAPRSLGQGYGMEVYVRKRMTSRLGGFLSYTFSRSVRSLGTEWFPSAFDRTHVLNTAIAYDLGRGWRIGTRLTLYTGAPVLTGVAGRLSPQDRASPPRDPAFYRIDWRLEKRWKLSGTRWVSFVAEFLNATLHKETISGQAFGPVAIPSLGLEGGF